MASETEYSNYQTVAAYVEAGITPHFRARAIMPNLMKAVNFQPGSASVKLRKAGSLTATAATESTAHSTSEYTETSPNTLTAAEVKVYTELSDKAIIFGGANVDDITAEAGRAIADKFDADAMALFDALNGGTVIGTSGADLTPALLVQAAYTARAGNTPGMLAYALHPVQVYDVQDDIVASGASVWTNPAMLDFLSGQRPAENGLRGMFFGVPVYESTNTESLNTAADWGGACFDVSNALAYLIAGGVRVKIGYNVKSGLTEIGVTFWYDVKENSDTSGVAIVTDQ